MSNPGARPIGIFDSGVGGLTVARKIHDRLPDEPFIYLGDTARVPYGNKSPATVQRYSENIARLLCDNGAKAIVVACNTASAYAREYLRDTLDVPVLSVIEPAAEDAVRTTRQGSIGVIGTLGTVKSGAYERAVAEYDPSIRVVSRACPLFVPLAEEGWTEGDIARQIARRYLDGFAETDIDVLILGCTHYPLLAPVITEVIEEVTGRKIAVLDSAEATSRRLAAVLSEQSLVCPTTAVAPSRRFWVTDISDSYVELCSRFFQAPVKDIVHVDL
jgi:glutamate racemase